MALLNASTDSDWTADSGSMLQDLTVHGKNGTESSDFGWLTTTCCFIKKEPLFLVQASSLLMARHVARQHADSVNCNGNFVKIMMLTRTAGDPDCIKGSPTYRQAICENRHARGRREVYICMYCR